MHNIDDEGEDDVLVTSSNAESGPVLNYGVHTSHNKPPLTHPTVPVPQLNAPSFHVEILVNGVPRDWGLENHDTPLVFPLRPNSQPSYPGTDGATHHAGSSAYYDPAPSQPEESPGFDSGPVGSGHGVTDFNAGSSAHGSDSGNMPHLVYEDIFQYPSENTQASDPSHAGLASVGGYSQAHHTNKGSLNENALEASFVSYQPVAASGKGNSYQPTNVKALPQLAPKPVISQEEVSQRVSEPIPHPPPPPPPPPPSSYIIQTRNGYQRLRYLHTKSSYSPEFPPPMPMRSLGVKRPATYPAAPKSVKNQ